jgi:signal transduction histidine kinase
MSADMQARRSRRYTGTIAIAVMTITIFVLDTITDLEIAAAVFYVVPILLIVRNSPQRVATRYTLLCIALAGISSILTRGGDMQAGVVNLVISIVAISIVRWMGGRILLAEQAFAQAREQLLRVARVNTLGGLTASIAHEVNQPLAGVVSSADTALRWLAADPPNLARARLAMQRVVEDAGRASATIERMRAMTRREPVVRESVDLATIVAESVALAADEAARRDICLHPTAIDEALPPLTLDRVQMVQVVVNLLLNAIEAISEAGGPDRLVGITAERRGATVCLIVSDTGPGVADHALTHLFEPFWTSKRGGSGLGLTIARDLVEAQGGMLRLEHGRTSGACFVAEFPLP